MCNKLRDVWKEVKKKSLYFYELKPFVKKCLTATDEAIGNSTDFIDSSRIMKNKHLCLSFEAEVGRRKALA